MSDNSSEPQTTTSTSEPPEFVKPFSQQFLRRAESLSRRGVQPALPSGEERVEPFSADQQAAFDLIRQRATEGDPTINQATAGLSQFLDPNAAFSPLANQLVDQNRQATIDDFNTSVAPSLAATASRSGSFGNTGVAELESIQRNQLGRSLGEVESGIRNQFLDRSLAASQLAPSLAAARTAGTQNLLTAGQQQQGLGQAVRDIDFQNLLAKREEPFTRLNVLGSAINTASGGFGRTTGQSFAPQTGNPFLAGVGAVGSLAGGLGQLATAF